MDHAVGLAGLALAIFSLIAPHRWPKVSRWITDAGLFVGAVLLALAAQSYLTSPDSPIPALRSMTVPVLTDPSPPVTQATVDSLRVQLAVTQEELKKTKTALVQRASLQFWGIDQPHTYRVIVDTQYVSEYENTSKLMLILSAVFSDVDRMTDTNIAKTSLYTITGAPVTIATSNPVGLRLLTDKSTMVEFDIALIPNSVSADQIKTLADVGRLGGKIIAAGSTLFTPVGAVTNGH